MSNENTPVEIAGNTETSRKVIGQLDHINLRLGWILSSCRVMDIIQLTALRDLVSRHAASIADLVKSLEDAGERTYDLCLLSIAQENITHNVGGFDSQKEEIRYMQQMDLRMREAYSIVDALQPHVSMMADAALQSETKAFLAGHIKSVKYYLQAL